MKYNTISAQNIQSAKHYGFDQQSNLLMEECGELIQAVNKYKRMIYSGKEVFSSLERLVEEIADVELMIEQIKALLNISDKHIDVWKRDKVERTRRRIEEEKNRYVEIEGNSGNIEPLPGEQ